MVWVSYRFSYNYFTGFEKYIFKVKSVTICRPKNRRKQKSKLKRHKYGENNVVGTLHKKPCSFLL